MNLNQEVGETMPNVLSKMYGHFADKEDSQLESVIWIWMLSLETS